jgi:hypothetical protein
MNLFMRTRKVAEDLPKATPPVAWPTPEEGDYPSPHEAEIVEIEFVMGPPCYTVNVFRVKIRNDRYSGGFRVATYRQRVYSGRPM